MSGSILSEAARRALREAAGDDGRLGPPTPPFLAVCELHDRGLVTSVSMPKLTAEGRAARRRLLAEGAR